MRTSTSFARLAAVGVVVLVAVALAGQALPTAAARSTAQWALKQRVAHSTADTDGAVLDIHLRLGPTAAAAAVAANAWVTAHGAPSNGIDLTTTSRPHVTLYLTSFQPQDLVHVVAAAQEVAAKWSTACDIPMFANNVSVVGTYAMWQMGTPPCLQLLSDLIVNATSGLITPNQPIPAWVKALPQPLRGLKEAMIKRYGSPNVFSQFQPHVTLAWDDAAGQDLSAVFAAMPPSILPGLTWQAADIGITYTGPHGTVPRNESQVVARIPLRT